LNGDRPDLNLLYVVHAILVEGSITRAARRLSLTQPAVSNALRRARVLFQDELLVRSPSGMRPTDRARAIWPKLEAALDGIADLTRTRSFDPATTTATFRVAVTASLEAGLVSRLIARFAAEALLATLCFQMHTNDRSISDLQQGRLDCAIGMFQNPPETLRTRGVLRDEHVCVLRRGHPAKLPLTLDSFSACRHILVTPSSRASGTMDTWLEMLGRQRDIAFIVNRYQDAMYAVEQTDLLTVIPLLFVEAHASPSLVTTKLPFQAEPILYKLLWHDRTTRCRCSAGCAA
jgi:DNA-binding transcriptional LysR family regulator